MAVPDDDYMASLLTSIEKAEEARIDAAKNTLRNQIISRLKNRGVATVRASYSGYGDSGAVETVDYFDAEGKPVAMRKSRSTRLPPIDDALCQVLCDFLPSGFENNDGGQGEITVDVEGGTVTIHHQENFVEHHDSTLEYTL